MDIYTEGVAIMIIGMGVVLITLAVLAAFTGLLERVFRPREDRPLTESNGDLGDGLPAEAHDAAQGFEDMALMAVAIHLIQKQRQQTYTPLARVSEQWKLVGRFKSLRR